MREFEEKKTVESDKDEKHDDVAYVECILNGIFRRNKCAYGWIFRIVFFSLEKCTKHFPICHFSDVNTNTHVQYLFLNASNLFTPNFDWLAWLSPPVLSRSLSALFVIL